jgi:hypothetical protein
MNLVRTAALFGAFALGSTALHAQQQLPADSMELGRKFTEWFYTGQADSLLAYLVVNPERPMTTDDIERSILQVASRAGNEVSVIEEKFITRNGARQYWRTAKMSILEEPFLLRWVITPEGKIGGLGMGPLSQAPPIDP